MERQRLTPWRRLPTQDWTTLMRLLTSLRLACAAFVVASAVLSTSSASASVTFAADLLEAEGLSLDAFAGSVAFNFSEIKTAIDGLGGSYELTGWGSVGGDLFAAGDKLRAVPEPSSIVLWGLGALVLAVRRHCRRFRAAAGRCSSPSC